MCCLLSLQSQCGTQDEAGDYPLTEASANGHSELVSLLIENGASVNAHTKVLYCTSSIVVILVVV